MTDSEQTRPAFFNPDPPSRQRPLVLVSEDHEDTRLLLRTILGTYGCVVIEAVDGQEAVQLAENSSPDLILMDSTLPRLDGLEATLQIRARGNGPRPPIVFVSGRAEPDFRDVALSAGCDEFLVKPINFELLSRVLEKHLGVRSEDFGV